MPRALLLLLFALCGPAWAAPPPEDSIAQRLAACSSCHGEQGRASRDGYYPRIAGKPAGYLYRQLINFRDGVRHHQVMQEMLEYLPDDYLGQIAGYFAAQHPQYAAAPASDAGGALLARGRTLALEGDRPRGLPACIACHGEALMGVRPDLPGLVGLPRDYLAAQLGAWRTGSRRMRDPDCMAQVVEKLSAEDVAAVTAWLSAQPVDPAAVPDPAPTRERPLRCGAAP
ncbi:MAG TPA: c-type cytochrome [Nevskia sp.]|jgi:cytochrome c553|nr:c-type cytochrome [Nevskia sp.]